MVQTRSGTGEHSETQADTISAQLAAIAAKLDAMDALKADVAALKAREHPRGGRFEEGESSTRIYNHRPMNKIEFPSFNGGDPRGWLLKAEKYFRYYAIQEDEKIEDASMHLEGEALDLYSWLAADQPLILWEDLVQALNRSFGPAEFLNPDEFLCSVKQTGSVQAYRQEFAKRSARVMNWSDHCLLGVFLNGLKEELRTDVRIHKPRTVYSAMSLALEFEAKANHSKGGKDGSGQLHTTMEAAPVTSTPTTTPNIRQ